MAQTLAYVRNVSEPEEPPPMLLSGPLVWAKDNLFSSIAVWPDDLGVHRARHDVVAACDCVGDNTGCLERA